MLYKTEFPNYDGVFVIPDGFEDVSYHNDVMPHVRKEIKYNGKSVEINIWQDFVDPDLREYADGKRFNLQIVVDGEILEEHQTDDWKEIKSYLANLDLLLNNLFKDGSTISEIVDKILTGVLVREALS